MKLIIDIPEYTYKNIKEYYEKNDIVEATYSYIYHGIPLPKGHGDLIDRDDLLSDSYCIDDWSGNEVNIVDVMTVKMAPTIIEADTEPMYYPQVDGITPTVVAESEE